MDGKGSRGLSSGDDRQRQHNLLKLGKKCAKYLATHKQSLLAVILLTGLVVLLFGVFSQFQVPATNFVPRAERMDTDRQMRVRSTSVDGSNSP